MFCEKCNTGTEVKSIFFGSKSVQATCSVCGITRYIVDIMPNVYDKKHIVQFEGPRR